MIVYWSSFIIGNNWCQNQPGIIKFSIQKIKAMSFYKEKTKKVFIIQLSRCSYVWDSTLTTTSTHSDSSLQSNRFQQGSILSADVTYANSRFCWSKLQRFYTLKYSQSPLICVNLVYLKHKILEKKKILYNGPSFFY